jgi:hypothetical protein
MKNENSGTAPIILGVLVSVLCLALGYDRYAHIMDSSYESELVKAREHIIDDLCLYAG